MSLQRYWALIELDEDFEIWIVRETIPFNPLGNFHPSLIWVECTDEVGQDWTYNEKTGIFTSPDGGNTVDVPLSQGARIAQLEVEISEREEMFEFMAGLMESVGFTSDIGEEASL